MADVSAQFDVAIIGGGLAGLTLALQLRQQSPALAIVVLERQHLPPPLAAHKVGESTVEIGAHYLSHTLGLQSLLERTQLRKFGLRFFFGSGGHDDLAMADELGASQFLPVISYQIDRGRLEGDLADIASERGITLMDACRVTRVEVSASGSAHDVHYVQQRVEQKLQCRWMIDASSRAAVIKRNLNISRPCRHNACAAWFRLDKSIAVDTWSDSPSWTQRCNGVQRSLSTNHLMGPGYWAWLIPLADARTSVGLVTDPAIHPLSSFNSFEKIQNCLSLLQPRLASEIADAKDTLMDFKALKNLSQDCTQVWSGKRWAMTGESGLFTDPLYSPGSDFIAISNTFICDLIAREKSQMELNAYAAIYQQMYQSFFASTMSLYEDQYPGLGDTRLMVAKTTWDYAYYWSVLAWLFFRDAMTDISFIKSIQPALSQVSVLNAKVQADFAKRASEKRCDNGSGRFFDQNAIPILACLNAELLEPTGNPGAEFARQCERLEKLAPSLLSILTDTSSKQTSDCGLLGDLRRRF